MHSHNTDDRSSTLDPLTALRLEVARAKQRTDAVVEAQRPEREALGARLAALDAVLCPLEDEERAARARLTDVEWRALGPWVVDDSPRLWASGRVYLAARDRTCHTARAWLCVAGVSQERPPRLQWTLSMHTLGSASTVQRVLGDAGDDPAGEWLRYRAEAERLLRAEGYVLTAPGQEVRDGGGRQGGEAGWR